MPKEDFEEAKRWVERYFIVLDPADNKFTISDFYDYLDTIEAFYNIRIFMAVIDPLNELSHDMRSKGNQRDLYFEEVLGEFRRNARATERHNMLIMHTKNLEKFRDKDSNMTYWAEPEIDDIAGGEANNRKGEQIIMLSKPRFFQKNEDGIPYESLYGKEQCNNIIKISCKKSKPKGVGKIGSIIQFYDWKKHRFYSLTLGGESVYAGDKMPEAPLPKELDAPF
jgi:hypothetical protein